MRDFIRSRCHGSRDRRYGTIDTCAHHQGWTDVRIGGDRGLIRVDRRYVLDPRDDLRGNEATQYELGLVDARNGFKRAIEPILAGWGKISVASTAQIVTRAQHHGLITDAEAERTIAARKEAAAPAVAV